MRVIATARLRLRPFVPEDAPALARVLSDSVAMRWYPAPFTPPEVDAWIADQRLRYERDGFGLWAVERLTDGAFVGDCGLAVRDLEGSPVVEVGYHVLPEHQGQGYATEAALACRELARDRFGVRRLFAFIRPENEPSRKVAAKLGMTVTKTIVRGRGAFRHEIWAVDLATVTS